jgi:hypothetical protein
MMIVWPDQWYHTSGDRIDKSDPTQMKRVAVIGASAAYTIASADDDMAMRMAGEIASNGTRRLGHQFIVAQGFLNGAEAGGLEEAYWMARAHVMGTTMAEMETVESVLELAEDQGRVGAYVEEMKEAVQAIGDAHLAALEVHMEAAALRLGTSPVRIRLTDLEREAQGIVPSQTALVTRDGYTQWRQHLNAVSAEVRSANPYGRMNTGEVQHLIDGRHSAFDIKVMLDAQAQTPTDLQDILNYLNVLEAAGLIEM